MDYWHIQMHKPEGRDSDETIDPKLMLQELQPVIGTGDWDDLQCRYFKGEQDGLQIGSIVMVRQGKEPIALVKVVSDYFKDANLEAKYLNRLYRHVEILGWNNEVVTSSLFTQGTLKRLYGNRNTESWQFINNWYLKAKTMSTLNNYIEILKYKKQIILQGPPGTGKTKLAKEIAFEITKSDTITEADIRKLIKPGLEIQSATRYASYIVDSVNDTSVRVKLAGGTIYPPSFSEIINAYKKQLWKGGLKNGNDSYAAAIAKYVFENSEKKEQIKLVQFHPSYSYEDLVRGIISQPNEDGDGILYEAADKLLMKLAITAKNNIKESLQADSEVVSDKWIDDKFDFFLADIEQKLTDQNHKISLTATLNLIAIKEHSFKIQSEGWKGDNLRFDQIKKLYKYAIKNRSELKQHLDMAKTVYHRTSYYFPVVEMFRKFLGKEDNSRESKATVSLKNYVLIIDEINRANLSSVLGELIYALEYRDEVVESMYELGGSPELSLPSNLYIIGTMNTADRSVGHIDYAIRRRFAFVDVLPQNLEKELGADFKTDIFKTVYDLFYNKETGHLSSEFEPQQVCLGHSYFIQHYEKDASGNSIKEKPIDFQLKVKYEIVPILEEYIRDGVLKESARAVVNELKQ